jgi:multicomponent K+:H+ antiporter subunit A
MEWQPHVPLLGELHLSSVLLFDIGVFMVVVGGTVLMLVAIAHQSLRRARKTLPVDDDPVAATQPAAVADV